MGEVMVVKLAEALILRADLQKRIAQLQQRLLRTLKVQEGEEPPEDPQDLMGELENLSAELLRLIQQINRTNSVTQLEGKSLSDALAERDTLKLKRSVYKAAVEAASERYDRYTRGELKVLTTINVAEVQKLTDSLAQNHRQLDTKIQALNWATDLIET
ncbi:conserved hypothetical protein [Limnospira indica PCC 8005]|uniref:DIP1984 family protein n=4 Tax=Limnospira TaxID=2596745 RepID=A0A9P1P0G4_9CYAN|nr:conserved hypothetical protein [Limnospira indica PCC 8005]